MSVAALLLWKRTSLPLTARGDVSPLSADTEDRFLISASSLHHVPLFALILHLGIFGKHLLVTPVDDRSVRDPRGLITRTKALCRRGTLAPMTRRQVDTSKHFNASELTGTDRYGGPSTVPTLGRGEKVLVRVSFDARYPYFVSVRVPAQFARWEISIGYLWWKAGGSI